MECLKIRNPRVTLLHKRIEIEDSHKEYKFITTPHRITKLQGNSFSFTLLNSSMMGTGTAALTRISMNESKVERDEDRRKKGFELKEYQISAVLAQAKS